MSSTLIQIELVHLKKRFFEQQVLRGIAADGKLRVSKEIYSQSPGFGSGLQDFMDVTVKITHSCVDLCNADSHYLSHNAAGLLIEWQIFL